LKSPRFDLNDAIPVLIKFLGGFLPVSKRSL